MSLLQDLNPGAVIVHRTYGKGTVLHRDPTGVRVEFDSDDAEKARDDEGYLEANQQETGTDADGEPFGDPFLVVVDFRAERIAAKPDLLTVIGFAIAL